MPSNHISPNSPLWVAAYGRTSLAISVLNDGNRFAYVDAVRGADNASSSITKAPQRVSKAYQGFNVEVMGGMDRTVDALLHIMSIDDKDVPDAVKGHIQAAKERLKQQGVNLATMGQAPRDLKKAIARNLMDGKIVPSLVLLQQWGKK